jgi:hypothetical protein
MSLDLTTCSALLGRAGLSQGCGGVKQGSDAAEAESAATDMRTEEHPSRIESAAEHPSRIESAATDMRTLSDVKQGSEAESAQSAQSADAPQPQSAGIQLASASASLEQARSIEIAPLDGGMYDLEAIFMHSGTATGGHYTAFLLVRQESGWPHTLVA